MHMVCTERDLSAAAVSLGWGYNVLVILCYSSSSGGRLNPGSVTDFTCATGMEVRKLELSRQELGRQELSSEVYLVQSPEKGRHDLIEVPAEEVQRLKARGRL